MNVAELRNELNNYPDDLEILVAKDPEGNGFNKLYSGAVGESYIEKNADKHGYVESTVHPDDAEDYDEDDLETRLVIWP